MLGAGRHRLVAGDRERFSLLGRADERQTHDKLRAATQLTVHVHHTAVLRDDAVHHTQPQTCAHAFFLGREEGIPDAAEQRRRDARAVIDHFHHDERIILDGSGDVQLQWRFDHRAFTAHRFKRLSRIHHEIKHHLLEARRVALDVHREL